MSRFRNLEFESGRETPVEKSVVRDEAFHLAEARALYLRGRFDGALRAYSRAVERNPGAPGGWAAQVRMLVELGEFREAKLWADKAAERFPRAPEVLAAKASALVRTGDAEAALAFSDASVEERGECAQVWLARGDVLLLLRQKGAQHCLERARGLAPADWPICWQASRIQAFHRQHARALAFSLEAVELAPDSAVCWLEVGRARKELGQRARARQSLVQARELDPDLPGVALLLNDLDRYGPLSELVDRVRSVFR
jgi:tetratricopeptide (TPR) repeat protein